MWASEQTPSPHFVNLATALGGVCEKPAPTMPHSVFIIPNKEYYTCQNATNTLQKSKPNSTT